MGNERAKRRVGLAHYTTGFNAATSVARNAHCCAVSRRRSIAAKPKHARMVVLANVLARFGGGCGVGGLSRRSKVTYPKGFPSSSRCSTRVHMGSKAQTVLRVFVIVTSSKLGFLAIPTFGGTFSNGDWRGYVMRPFPKLRHAPE